MPSTRERLRKMSIFRSLSDTELDKLESMLHATTYRPGGTIISEGDSGDELYLVLSGFVNIVRGSGDQAVFLTILSEGEYFGEACLFHDLKRTATVVATSQAGNAPTEVALISKKNFMEFLKAYPAAGNQILLQILRDLFSRLQRTSMELQFSRKDVLPQDEIDKLLS